MKKMLETPGAFEHDVFFVKGFLRTLSKDEFFSFWRGDPDKGEYSHFFLSDTTIQKAQCQVG